MDKRAYLAWLQSIQGSPQNEGFKKALDWVQTAGDVASLGLSFVPGANVIGSAIDAVSAGIDVAQGDYLDAGLRGTAAGVGLIPGGGAAVKIGAAATNVGKAAKTVETAKAIGGAAKAVETATTGTKVGQATIGAAKAGKGTVDAVQAAKAGTSGAGAVTKGTEVAAGAAIGTKTATTATSLGGRMAGAAKTTTKAVAKTAQAVNDYGAKHQSNASNTFGSKDSQYYSDPKRPTQQEREFLAPVSAEAQSNLVSQGTKPTDSRKRDSMDPAFSYRGAYGMFRPVGYGMNENNLNKMVNTHVNKFLKSKKGKELKSEVKNIAKKRVD